MLPSGYLFIILLSLTEEFKEVFHILLIAEGTAERTAMVIDGHIEWLGEITEFHLLQITPLITDGTQCLFLSIERHLYRLLQWCLVVHKE